VTARASCAVCRAPATARVGGAFGRLLLCRTDERSWDKLMRDTNCNASRADVIAWAAGRARAAERRKLKAAVRAEQFVKNWQKFVRRARKDTAAAKRRFRETDVRSASGEGR